jgi:hypothetical protein
MEWGKKRPFMKGRFFYLLPYLFTGNFVLHHFIDAVHTLFTQSRTFAITISSFLSCTVEAYERDSRHMIVQIGTSSKGRDSGGRLGI